MKEAKTTEATHVVGRNSFWCWYAVKLEHSANSLFHIHIYVYVQFLAYSLHCDAIWRGGKVLTVPEWGMKWNRGRFLHIKVRDEPIYPNPAISGSIRYLTVKFFPSFLVVVVNLGEREKDIFFCLAAKNSGRILCFISLCRIRTTEAHCNATRKTTTVQFESCFFPILPRFADVIFADRLEQLLVVLVTEFAAVVMLNLDHLSQRIMVVIVVVVVVVHFLRRRRNSVQVDNRGIPPVIIN